MKKQEFLKKIEIDRKQYNFYDINILEDKGIPVSHLPFSIRVLVENILRHLNAEGVTEKDLINIGSWKKYYQEPLEIPYHPARVLMQDFTGVPAVVDLAAMRDALQDMGGDPRKINPLIPVELIADHSVQVDAYGSVDSLTDNVAKEYERNSERYAFLKWAQTNFSNFSVVPPNSGICHQVNLEYLARVVIAAKYGNNSFLYPDTLVGTDSHTTMINGLGVIGWGVGGIEAEAVILGQPYYMAIPEVIGVRLVNTLRPGVTATDLVLTISNMLRHYNVVEKFVEFFGEGSKKLRVTDRATIANMSPEYGATMGFFPVDEKTIEYLEKTNRTKQARITEEYAKRQGLFYTGETIPEYTDIIEIDLADIEPCLAGPSRPQDRITLREVKNKFRAFLHSGSDIDASVIQMSRFFDESGCVTCRQENCVPCNTKRKVNISLNDKNETLGDGDIVIAAITSCTNTSNPFVLIGAGLLAKKAVNKGLQVPPHVKTSLAPGSKVVIDYLEDAGLMPFLQNLGFHLAGYGCTTCIGNSGPLHPHIEKAIIKNDLFVASVLSGNRNFEARIHQNIKANFLASPMLVVAYAICGRIDVDLQNEPLALDANGAAVYLKDIWPDNSEIESLVKQHVKKDFFKSEYARIFDGDDFWQDLHIVENTTFNWDEDSNYIKKPPYFNEFRAEPNQQKDIINARPLLLLDDSITTDHISPAGAIQETYPAGRYLLGRGIEKEAFNSYGSRRGNHEVMMRGTFGNIRIKNRMISSRDGSFTRKYPEKKEMYVYDAACQYQNDKTPLIVLAGKEYGTGSSRDWAAKGTHLLGVKAVFAESFERIHRSNLVGMGVLPLRFQEGESWKCLEIDGSEIFTIRGVSDMKPRKTLQVTATKDNGNVIEFSVISQLNTDIDVKYFEHGGILPYVLRKIMTS